MHFCVKCLQLQEFVSTKIFCYILCALSDKRKHVSVNKMLLCVVIDLNMLTLIVSMVMEGDYFLHDVLFICVQKYSICSTAKKMTGVSVTSLQWWYVRTKNTYHSVWLKT